MWGFPFVAWMFLVTFLVLRGGRRRWRRFERWEHDRYADAGRPTREDDVQLLEVRMARLEERLDFAEKLLMERGEPAK
jgi:hypothetical protein